MNLFNLKNTITLGCALTIVSMTSTGFADNALNTACANYLSGSDESFNALVSASTDKAKTMASTLNACETANACADIANNDTCSTVLANRAFLSNYYANYIAASDQPSSPSSGGLGAGAPLPQSPNNNIVPPPVTPSTTHENPTTPSQKSTTKSASSVHWF